MIKYDGGSMSLEFLVQKVKSVPELTQAFMRIMIASSIMIVLFFAQFFYTDFFTHILIAASIYVVYSIVWFIVVYKYTGFYPVRRILGILVTLVYSIMG